MSRDQLCLFELPSAPVVKRVAPAPQDASCTRMAGELPASLRLGTSSWTFPGWAGLVYDREAPERVLTHEGLTAYAAHPLFRTVCIDRTFYAPVAADVLERYAACVPEDFEFVVKAHEWCTWVRFPDHPRYGDSRGRPNPHYLDAEYARTAVIEPTVAGLGRKLGVVLFQFPPQELADFGLRRGFVRDLDRFLSALPRGPRYAFELRTHQLFCAETIAVLRSHGAVYTYLGHPAMHELHHQHRHVDPSDDPFMVVRWMLAKHQRFERAGAAYAPFDRLVDPDERARASICALIQDAGDRPTYVIVNNNAEGSAPLSIEHVAHRVASHRREATA